MENYIYTKEVIKDFIADKISFEKPRPEKVVIPKGTILVIVGDVKPGILKVCVKEKMNEFYHISKEDWENNSQEFNK